MILITFVSNFLYYTYLFWLPFVSFPKFDSLLLFFNLVVMILITPVSNLLYYYIIISFDYPLSHSLNLTLCVGLQRKMGQAKESILFHIAKHWLIDKLPKLQMIKSILRQHLDWLQAALCIVNNIAICEVPTVGN